jgi:cadmium resistance protein CadD (predicted permease)
MGNFIGFIAVVLAALCAVFTFAFVADLPYIKSQKSPLGYALLSLFCIASTGLGAWYLW